MEGKQELAQERQNFQEVAENKRLELISEVQKKHKANLSEVNILKNDLQARSESLDEKEVNLSIREKNVVESEYELSRAKSKNKAKEDKLEILVRAS